MKVYKEDVLQGAVKHLNMSLISGQEWVFQQKSVPAKIARYLGYGCGGTFWPSSAPRIGFRGVQTSKIWKINCGLFWRTLCAESITVHWRAWGDHLWRQQQRSPWRQSMQRQQSGWSISRLASRLMAAILSDIIINWNLKLVEIKNYIALNMGVLLNSPPTPRRTCNRRLGMYELMCYNLRMLWRVNRRLFVLTALLLTSQVKGRSALRYALMSYMSALLTECLITSPEYDHYPLCMRWCFIRLLFFLNALLHTSQV